MTYCDELLLEHSYKDLIKNYSLYYGKNSK